MHITGIAKSKPISTIGNLTAIFVNGRRSNFVQFEIVQNKDLQIGEEFQGILGLNILRNSEISLKFNFINLEDNVNAIPMNIDIVKRRKKLVSKSCGKESSNKSISEENKALNIDNNTSPLSKLVRNKNMQSVHLPPVECATNGETEELKETEQQKLTHKIIKEQCFLTQVLETNNDPVVRTEILKKIIKIEEKDEKLVEKVHDLLFKYNATFF